MIKDLAVGPLGLRSNPKFRLSRRLAAKHRQLPELLRSAGKKF